MKTKSKVTSIRVEPELYDKFKEVVEAEGRQVSAVVCRMMNRHIESHEMQMDLRQRNHDRLKIGFDKIKDQIDWSKVSRHTFVTITRLQIVNARSNIELMIDENVKATGFVNPVPYILETGDCSVIDIFVVEPNSEMISVMAYKFVSIEEGIRMLQAKEINILSELPDGRYTVEIGPRRVSKETWNKIKDIRYPTIEQIEEAEKDNSK